MELSSSHRSLLIFAGLLGVGIGGAILLAPVQFLGTSGITLGDSIGLLSEIRAPGGAILASGLFILWGALARRLAFTATVVATLMSLSYGLSRVLSLALDGYPGPVLVGACCLELTVGIACVAALTRRRDRQLA